jgi:hypothetical protein
MKKITLLLSFITASFCGFGQSLTSTGLTSPLYGDENTILDGGLWIHNISSASLDILVYRTVVDTAPGHTTNFCWGISCYGDTTNLATDPVTIAPGDSNHSFHAYINPHGFFGLSHICYDFFDMNNPGDSVSVCFDYDISVGIQTHGVSVSSPLSQASPNPSYGITNINFMAADNKSRIVIYNLLGVVVKEIALSSKQGALILSTSDLNKGVYYYSLVSGDKTLATKKLVVANK